MSNYGFVQKKFDFELPEQLQKAIDELEQAVLTGSNLIDCYQDEVWSTARFLDDDEKESQVIDYYCRRRWI